jgi:hypothetical protein
MSSFIKTGREVLSSGDQIAICKIGIQDKVTYGIFEHARMHQIRKP